MRQTAVWGLCLPVVLLVSGCQEDLIVGGQNGCGVAIEASVDDSATGEAVWVPLEVGANDELGGLVEDPEVIYLDVRRRGEEPATRFSIPHSTWSAWRTSGDYELLIPIDGEYCPEAGQ